MGIKHGIWSLLALFVLFIGFGFLWAIFKIPAFYLNFVQNIRTMREAGLDEIAIAMQLGRLDVVSLAMACLGIGVGFFAIFSFWQIRQDAREIAADVAKVSARAEILAFVESQLDDKVKDIMDRLREKPDRVELPNPGNVQPAIAGENGNERA